MHKSFIDFLKCSDDSVDLPKCKSFKWAMAIIARKKTTIVINCTQCIREMNTCSSHNPHIKAKIYDNFARLYVVDAHFSI